MQARLRSLVHRLWPRSRAVSLPLRGYRPSPVAAPHLESLGDADLEHLNRLLDWKAFVTDAHGRRFGNAAWRGKRDQPQEIPDPRIELLDRLVGLAGKDVLEIGCFEGIHTIALQRLAKDVTAVDARIENVVKTIVRCAFFGLHPTVLRCDVDVPGFEAELPEADVLHHVGVLYHLEDPVAHLHQLAPRVRGAILLDTHFAAEGTDSYSYESFGRPFRYAQYREGGRADVFSGMKSFARWLRLDDLHAILTELGFQEALHEEVRQERNGARVLLVKRRPSYSVG